MSRATVLACLTLTTACAPKAPVITPAEAASTPPSTGVDEVALELDFRGLDAQGFVRLIQRADHLEVGVIVEEATPGAHDLCIHEYGDCSDPEFLRAGLHYDPVDHAGEEHGHAGDLGTLRVAGDGRGEVVFQNRDLHLDEVLWRSVVMHAEADHGHGHDAHGAGFRLACGSIQPGDRSQLAELEWELMDLRHYVQQLGTTTASRP
jgi:Cu-Zn family superoxide dismutase